MPAHCPACDRSWERVPRGFAGSPTCWSNGWQCGKLGLSSHRSGVVRQLGFRVKREDTDGHMAVEVLGLDHLYITVSDLRRSEEFYDAIMERFGFRKGDSAIGGDPHAHYFNRHLQYTIRPARRGTAPHDPYSSGLHHVCFQVSNRDAVDEAHRELTRLGIPATEPREYPEYNDDYYATFFSDPDGIRLELVARSRTREEISSSWSLFRVFLNPLTDLRARRGAEKFRLSVSGRNGRRFWLVTQPAAGRYWGPHQRPAAQGWIGRARRKTMRLEGGCYCGALRYLAEGNPLFKGQCHCRECQYISGGHPNAVIAMPAASFAYTKSSPKQFRRSDLSNPVTREFCAECGTHLLTRSPGLPGAVILKVGTLDDPSVYGGPQMVIFTIDKQSFHHVPEGVPVFERMPG